MSKLATYIDENANSRGLAKKIASYLIETKQTLKLDSLMRDVMTEREDAGIYEIQLVTAHPLTSSQEKDVVSYIKKVFPNCKKVILDAKVDPSLLGGVRVESANFLIDRSLKSKLHYLKSSLQA